MTTPGKENFFAKSKKGYRKLPNWGKAVIIIFLSCFLLLTAGWFVMAWYIHQNKKELLEKITDTVGDNINGNLHIENMEPALLNGFPNISIRLIGVTLSDSMYTTHKKNLLNLQSVYVKINAFSLLSKRPKIMKVTIADGSVYLFTDKNGYSNTYLFKKDKDKPKKGKGKEIDIANFGVENVLFTFDHFERNKQFKVTVNNLNGVIKRRNGGLLDIKTNTKAYFHQLGFNLARGGFVKNKNLKAPLHILFNTQTKELKLPQQNINVDGTIIRFGCVFNFGHVPADYTIDIYAPSIGFKEGTSYLSRHIAKKLDSFDLKNKLTVKVKIDGTFQYPDTPMVNAQWQTTSNVLSTSYGDLEKISLKGQFVNTFVPGKGRGDANSAIIINSVSATYYEIPFIADSIVLYGLVNPLMKLKIASRFPVEKLDAVVEDIFDFEGGYADINLNYTGPVLATDTFRHSMFGHIRIKDAALTYIPRSLFFKKCNVNIEFTGSDLFLRNTTLSSPSSTVNIEGTAQNFMNVYFLDPGKVNFNWNINSSRINLNEYISLIAPRQKKTTRKKKSGNYKVAKIAGRLEYLMEKSSMHLQTNITHLTYKRFDAHNINAHIALTDKGINLSDVRLQHAGGNLTASANLLANNGNSPFDIKAKVNNIRIDKLFYAFENFGQQTLKHEHLQGLFSADIDVKGSLKSDGHLVKNSMNGRVSFTLSNGKLSSFPPLESINKFVFKNRDLSNITFKTLKNDLHINHGKITINPMSIESSALTINVDGVYAFDKGTDISIAIPLRNPKKDEERVAKGLKPKKDKGIIVYLRAQDGDDGKVNISWDPLKKGVRDDGLDDDVKQE